MNTNKIFARVFNLCRRFPVKKNRITLIEKINTGGTGSLFSLKEECERRGLPFEYNIIRHADYDMSPKNLPGLIKLFTLKVYRMATSSHIFLNDNFMPIAYMNIAKETRIIQLWHGMGSYKKFGGSSESEEEVALLKKVNEHVTHILASAEGIRDNYAEAFCVPKEKVLTIGCPQVDYYFKKHNLKAWRQELMKQYPAIKGKKLVLYAPTFRGDKEKDKELLSHFDFDAFARALGDEYCLMVRLHPQIQSGQVPANVINMTDYPNVRKLLLLTDVLIADYSSIAVEYALLNRPIVLYAYDKDWYLHKDRGFYYDFDRYAPGPVVENMDQLIRTMKEKNWDLARVEAFARLHNDYYDDQSAARVVDYYFGKEPEKEKEGQMKIIAGLGNPTDQYKGTRHNVGFMAIDKISEKCNIAVNQHKFKAMTGSGIIGGQRVLLLKPLTYMNNSGESLRQAADFYKVPLEDILVIYDDISLEPGMMRIRKKGGAGGHNGMKSIINHLGGDTFPRIRVGIGGEKHPGMDLADYVLGHFTADEKKIMDDILDKAALASELIMAEEMEAAMNKYNIGNKKKPKKKKRAQEGQAEGEKGQESQTEEEKCN